MHHGRQVALGMLALVTCTLVVLLLCDRVGSTDLPAHLPSDWTATAPCVWVFVRPGCGHCETHLAALDHALRTVDASRRRRVLERVHAVGSNRSIPTGVHMEPDSLRRAWGVRTTPLTVLVDAGGHPIEMWRGARGIRAWERAIDVLDDGKEIR